jgi:trans-2,3-dihydro-3-hydroxyanthranilate isomerase
MSSAFYIVDVFAESPLAGNQLAVFVSGAQHSSAQMQDIAREMHFSETAFLFPPRADGAHPIRIFTPEAELPFAGHPTLGAARIVLETRTPACTDTLLIAPPCGPLRVDASYDADGRPGLLTMQQNPPVFGPSLSAEQAARLLGLEPHAVRAERPCSIVSTGIAFAIVPVRTISEVQRAQLDRAHSRTLFAAHDLAGVLVFAPAAMEAGHDLHCRVFVPELGIVEDPATGSANGCLAAWLLRHEPVYQERLHLIVEQGYEMKRPSMLTISGWRVAQDAYDIRVGGRTQLIAQGDLLL